MAVFASVDPERPFVDSSSVWLRRQALEEGGQALALRIHVPRNGFGGHAIPPHRGCTLMQFAHGRLVAGSDAHRPVIPCGLVQPSHRRG